MTKIVKAVQTSFGAPSQWDTWTDDGRYLYLRYRHSWGTATFYPSSDVSTWDLHTAPAYSFDTERGPHDGDISLGEFCELAGIALTVTLEKLRADTKQWWHDQLVKGLKEGE